MREVKLEQYTGTDTNRGSPVELCISTGMKYIEQDWGMHFQIIQ
jgi:hypothetical protein